VTSPNRPQPRESLEERLANRRQPGDADYDPFYDAGDAELAAQHPLSRDDDPPEAAEAAAADDWDNAAAIANALLANAGKGIELWTDPAGDVVGSPLDVARIALKALNLPARDARVRAQVAEEIAEELAEWARRQRAQADAAWNPQSSRALRDYALAYDNAAGIARQHAGAPSVRPEDSTAGDSGTPIHPEPQEER
jgi:hypothetical protein